MIQLSNKAKYLIVGTIVIIATAYFFMNPSYSSQVSGPLFYIPIGDSYTIGTGASAADAWAAVLAANLTEAKIETTLIANPAKSGYATAMALREELPVVESKKPNFTTVMLGANDIVQGVTPEKFEENYREILSRLEKAGVAHIVLINIPDFTATPEARHVGPTWVAVLPRIKEFNRIISKLADEKDLIFVDLLEESREVAKDPKLLSKDGLHPSAEGHKVWEKKIRKTIVSHWK